MVNLITETVEIISILYLEKIYETLQEYSYMNVYL